jgi:hypothetical protein
MFQQILIAVVAGVIIEISRIILRELAEFIKNRLRR